LHRFAAVVLPSLRIELVRTEMPDVGGPLALVIAREGGAVKDERSLLGNTRLDEVSPEAHAVGVRPRQTIAAARAKYSALAVRVVKLGVVEEALSRIAEALLAFGTTTAFDLESNTVWVDVTGCAHLHGGEEPLRERIEACVVAMHHACRVSIADGPLVAAAVARHAAKVVPSGHNAEGLAPLPIRALPLPDDATAWLERLGLGTVGDLQRLPRSSLAVRLGADAPRIMGLLGGQDDTPLKPYVPPAVPEESATLEYGIETTEPLFFVMKKLCDGLACRLAGRVMAVAELDVVLGLDRAFAPSSPQRILSLVLSAPLTEADELLRVVRARLESYMIEAPILSVKLRAVTIAPRQRSQLHLFVPEAKAARVIPRLAAELEAILGRGTVGTLHLGDRWLPGHRSCLLPLHGAPRPADRHGLHVPDSHTGALLSGAEEPTRWLAVPLPCSRTLDVQVVARLEAGEWWTRGVIRRDYGTAWIESVPAMAWVEIDRVPSITGGCAPPTPAEDRLAAVRSSIRGWMD
jgi:protein ImuB